MTETPTQTVTLELSRAEMSILRLACDLAVIRAESIHASLLGRPRDRRNAGETITAIRLVQAKVKAALGD